MTVLIVALLLVAGVGAALFATAVETRADIVHDRTEQLHEALVDWLEVSVREERQVIRQQREVEVK